MHLLPTPSETALPGSADGAQWSRPAAWHAVDDDVTLTFGTGRSPATPQTLRWRGSSWHVVGIAQYWSTWHSLAVEPAGEVPPTCRGLRTSFWRFAAQTNPMGPVLHFEVRGAGDMWRLIRLGVDFALPAPSRPAAVDRGPG